MRTHVGLTVHQVLFGALDAGRPCHCHRKEGRQVLLPELLSQLSWSLCKLCCFPLWRFPKGTYTVVGNPSVRVLARSRIHPRCLDDRVSQRGSLQWFGRVKGMKLAWRGSQGLARQ